MHKHIQYLVGYCTSLLCLVLTVFVFSSVGGSYQLRVSSSICVCQVSICVMSLVFMKVLCIWGCLWSVFSLYLLFDGFPSDLHIRDVMEILQSRCMHTQFHWSSSPRVCFRHEGPGFNHQGVTCMKPGFSCKRCLATMFILAYIQYLGLSVFALYYHTLILGSTKASWVWGCRSLLFTCYDDELHKSILC